VEENIVKLMRVAWLTLPLGVFITVAASLFVFWWQELSYSNPYAQAILINGKVLCLLSIFPIPCFAVDPLSVRLTNFSL
jgi:oligosaccharide translocation protein RFT1